MTTKLEELEKELKEHWERNKKSRKKTHSGRMYEEYMEKMKEKK